MMATLQDVRNNVEEHHSRWFAEVEELCARMNTEPSLPRLCGRQRHRPNNPSAISIRVLLPYHLDTSIRSPAVGNEE